MKSFLLLVLSVALIATSQVFAVNNSNFLLPGLGEISMQNNRSIFLDLKDSGLKTSLEREDYVSAHIYVLQCDQKTPDNATVTFTGLGDPCNVYSAVTDSFGVVYFDSIEKGYYDLEVSKIGYDSVFYYELVAIEDFSITVMLSEHTFIPRNLRVDTLTSVATWDVPLVTGLQLEDFEDTVFPPPGWQQRIDDTNAYGWHRAGSDEYFTDWTVPDWEGHYALYNDNIEPSAGLVQLITPAVDLRESDNFKLRFDRFFSGWGGDARIDYSIDAGSTWVVLKHLEPSSEWEKEVLDLSALSGVGGYSNIMFAFVHESVMMLTGGFAVDSVEIVSDPAVITSYGVYLNNAQVATLDSNQTSYTFQNLEFGHYYTATVRAGYMCGLSDKANYSWQSGYLYQPRNMVLNYVTETDEVVISWKAPVDSNSLRNAEREVVPEGLLSFTVYRNNDSITNIPYNGESPDEEFMYVDNGVNPGLKEYKLTALYDLFYYERPGETGESGPSNDSAVYVRWGYDMPFTESWNVPDFDFNDWSGDFNKWVINENVGDDAPSAQFHTAAQDTGYEASLVSTFFKGDSVNVGDVWLDFNLKLDDLSQTGTEHLAVEVFQTGSWHTIYDTVNNGSFNFEEGANHINIFSYALGSFFRVRFRAYGNNSSNINSWFVDNISISRTCREPKNITGEYYWKSDTDFGSRLSWEPPDTTLYGSGNQTGLSGFKLYRSNCCPEDGYEEIAFIPFQDTALVYQYDDNTDSIPIQVSYWYKVSAVWAKDNDECESVFAESKLMPEVDYVSVLVTRVGDADAGNDILVYPNPAKDVVFITSHEPFSRVTVFDFSGKVVADLPVNNKTRFELNTRSFKASVYIVRIKDENHEAVKRFVIVR